MTRDGRCQIHISEDKLTAYASFTPAAPGGKAVDLKEIELMIQAEHISHGIDWEAIRSALYSCNTEHKRITSQIIARGTEPKMQLPAALVFNPAIRSQSRIFRQIDGKGQYHPIGEGEEAQLYEKESEESNGRIDHRERNSIQVIHEGQVLAKKLPMQPGEFGTTVTGEQIPFEEVNLKSLVPGLNTREDGNRIISEVSGRLVWDKTTFGIDTKIEISGDVGYATGNIRFPGNIILKGEIQDGFRIWSGGNIFSKSTIDAYEIFCKGNLICAEGILGKNEGIVRVKGDMEAKFIENARVDVFGDIVIKTAIMNARVNSNGSILLEKGKIVGGQTRFLTKISVSDVGNRNGVRTILIGGSDFVNTRKLEISQKRFQELSGHEQKLTHEFERSPSDKTGKSLKAARLEIEQVQTEIGELMEMTSKIDPDCAVEVSGTAYAGTIIRFGRLEKVLTEDMQRKRFRADTEANRLLVEDL